MGESPPRVGPVRGGGVGDIRVLHVDDEQDVADLTAAVLEQSDDAITVTSVTSADEALDRIESESFDCVVSDYQMPGMDGIELLEAVRKRYPDLPFILFTGKGSEEVASRAISAGVTDYLQKSTGSDEYEVLAQQIETVVERHRAVERFETFLESAPDSILIVDEAGTIEQVNHQTEELFGYERGELVGEPVETLLPERFREAHVRHREEYLQSPEARPMGADLDLYALHADGSEFPVDIAISPIDAGGHTEVMAAIRDISSRKWREEQLREREAELERQNERLDEFASVVSHDLRNPLSVAAGSLELARETGDDEHIERAEAALDRMDDLVTELLTLARTGQTVEDLEAVPLETVVTAAWTTARTENGDLEVDLGTGEILADRGRLTQVFENLFHNAVEHVGEHVTVRVGWLDDGGGFYVADDGPGIPEAERDDVFEFGYSTRDDGNGFGLGIVRSIVEAHGWSIAVTESREGGARFEVTGVETA